MEKQNTIPAILRWKVIYTILTGFGIGIVAAITFAVSKDHTLLALGGILLLWCLFRGVILWRSISAGHYESVTGVCTAVVQPAFHRYKKVHLTLENGNETILLLGAQAKVKPDTCYRFYFQNSSAPRLGNDYLDAALSTNVFLGYEESATE